MGSKMKLSEGSTAAAAVLKVSESGIEAERRDSIDAWRRAGRMDKACMYCVVRFAHVMY